MPPGFMNIYDTGFTFLFYNQKTTSMKKLQAALLIVLGLGVYFTVTGFKPEAKPANPKQTLILLNFKPVAVRCLTAAGVPYAVHTNCAASPGSLCAPTQCPNGPVFALNRRPTVINCTTAAGVLIAFGNTCTAFAGSICQPNPCP